MRGQLGNNRVLSREKLGIIEKIERTLGIIEAIGEY
jgi:hypothetical protein